MTKQDTYKNFLKRFRNLNFVKGICSLYIVFSIFFAIFALNYNVNFDIKDDNSNFINELVNTEDIILSNRIKEPINLLNLSISPLHTHISYMPFNKFEEITSQIITAEIPKTNIDSNISEESTTLENETTILDTEQSTELTVDDDSSLDEYINYLINYYSSYNTRIDLTYDNILLLSHLAIAEAEGQSLEGRIAVCEVAINRSITREQTLYQVIYSQNKYGTPQFSCTKDGRIDLTPRKEDALAAVKAVLGEQPTNGSIYFDNPDKAPNSWAARNRKKSVKIDSHQFYYDLPKD